MTVFRYDKLIRFTSDNCPYSNLTDAPFTLKSAPSPPESALFISDECPFSTLINAPFILTRAPFPFYECSFSFLIRAASPFFLHISPLSSLINAPY